MRLIGYKRIHGIIRLKSGLRIGMSKDQMAIGDVDNPVIRNPLTEEPYIPGSSLKGKMRYLLEWHLGGDYISRSSERHVYVPDDPKDPVGRIFGSAPSNEAQRRIAQERGPTRLLVRDAYLTPNSKQALERMTARGGYLTEVKQEVFIPRIGGNANPRTAERVPAGAEFAFEMVYRVMDTGDGGQTDRANFHHVEKALELLQLDGLGGYISRGYGQVELDYRVEEK
ncbi:CRISPR-associated RAMP protein, Csm3 family [Allomeiothermus silvanus DSM 9946]|uniref:CRISPR system Cms endoribonuclease Csm3 n=1 Tax=Allomeiothermus silvanus (strain ATCC 700542 / DSM 9946 / NBRC 106475 / NCIMB 13440 / VI-R2) TaxID=526227 RepID=D7BB56_ALLS1|nr:type III-A CRISPR-associated RAMP protein Csm3 [Allomeiothermus silvanus]ADH62616.1 CRISPR-associated RAMP protein, Csm3 family [Allomeiothermus silvanus DSM 9946]